MSEDRPSWANKQLSERDFRRVYLLGMIVSIAAKREMTSADTSREWLEASNSKGETVIMPPNWSAAWKFCGYASNPGLFVLTSDGERMRDQLDAIDKWEAQNAIDRAEFERLCLKFGNTTPDPNLAFSLAMREAAKPDENGMVPVRRKPSGTGEE